MLCSRCSPLRFFVNGTVRAQVRSPLCGFPHALLRNFPGEPRAARSVRWVLSQTAPFRCPRERVPASPHRSGLHALSDAAPNAEGFFAPGGSWGRRRGPFLLPRGGAPCAFKAGGALALSPVWFRLLCVTPRDTPRARAAAAPPVASLGRVRGRKRRGGSAGCGRRSVPAIRGWKPSGPRSAGTKRRETRSSPLPIPAPAGADALWVGGGGACARRRWI